MRVTCQITKMPPMRTRRTGDHHSSGKHRAVQGKTKWVRVTERVCVMHGAVPMGLSVFILNAPDVPPYVMKTRAESVQLTDIYQ
jgi:hypothetical protein